MVGSRANFEDEVSKSQDLLLVEGTFSCFVSTSSHRLLVAVYIICSRVVFLVFEVLFPNSGATGRGWALLFSVDTVVGGRCSTDPRCPVPCL